MLCLCVRVCVYMNVAILFSTQSTKDCAETTPIK